MLKAKKVAEQRSKGVYSLPPLGALLIDTISLSADALRPQFAPLMVYMCEDLKFLPLREFPTIIFTQCLLRKVQTLHSHGPKHRRSSSPLVGSTLPTSSPYDLQI
jgi:hypothetical protein